jgi:hypothetical protein
MVIAPFYGQGDLYKKNRRLIDSPAACKFMFTKLALQANPLAGLIKIKKIGLCWGNRIRIWPQPINVGVVGRN